MRGRKTARVWLQGDGGGLKPGQAFMLLPKKDGETENSPAGYLGPLRKALIDDNLRHVNLSCATLIIARSSVVSGICYHPCNHETGQQLDYCKGLLQQPESGRVGSPTAAFSENSKNYQKQHGSDGGRGDRADHTGTNVDIQLRQQPGTDKSANDADDEVANETETCSAHELSGEPSGNDTNDQYDEQALIGNLHGVLRSQSLCALEAALIRVRRSSWEEVWGVLGAVVVGWTEICFSVESGHIVCHLNALAKSFSRVRLIPVMGQMTTRQAASL
jgi:hypothetical protein